MRISEYSFVFFLIFLISGCISTVNRENKLPKEAVQAEDYLEKGNILLLRNELISAEVYFRESYDIYTLINYSPGKIKAASGIIRSLIQQRKSDEALRWLKKTKEMAKGENIHARQELLLIESEYLFAGEKYGDVISLLSGGNFKEYPLHIRAELISYLLMSKIKLSSDCGSETAALSEVAMQMEKLLQADEFEYPLSLSFSLYTLGYSMMKGGNPGDAVMYLEAALKIDSRYANYRGTADDMMGLGYANYSLNRFDEAGDFFMRASEIYEIIGDDHLMKKAREMINKISGADSATEEK